MIKDFVNKLIDEMPENVISKIKKTKSLNLVLEGGIFNGSYLIGILYFLKELEDRKYIKIKKFSGCSIGAICALLYLIDGLDMTEELYSETVKNFKENHNFQFINIFLERIKKLLHEDMYKKLNRKLYICYYDIEKKEKIVKSHFESNDDLLESIRRSSFVPFIINGEIACKDKFVDGVFPYIFSLEERKKTGKTLYLDLVGSDKIQYLISVKNEDNNFHRIITGILDIHLFFIKEKNTKICSYVEDWKLYDILIQRFLKYFIEKIVFWIICFICLFKKYIQNQDLNQCSNKRSEILDLLKEKIKLLYSFIIKSYCF